MSAELPDIPVPGEEGLVAWAVANPDAVRAAIGMTNLLKNLQAQFTTPVGARSGPWNIVGSPQQLLLMIPIVFPQTLADHPTYSATAAGAYDQTQIQTLMNAVGALIGAHNTLLQQLRNVNINPSNQTA